MTLQAPFPWFGGKSRVAPEVWEALGDVDNYAEPFAGSLAVLLARPTAHRGRVETVNDADHFLSNFWRAVAADPDAVARFADWPVNEDDLFARHLWLVNTGREILAAGIHADPAFYDAKVAGWWVWGQCCWIGSGWCSGTGPWKLGDGGRGVNRQLPHLGTGGQGVNRKHEPLAEWMHQLAARLDRVRVCTGDWSRIVTTGALNYGSTVGVFLDPPYADTANRTDDLYATDSLAVAHDVREWAITNGDNPRLRIVLAGYDGEHDMPDDWRVHEWSGTAAYQNSSGTNQQNAENRHKERLWMSPACLTKEQEALF